MSVQNGPTEYQLRMLPEHMREGMDKYIRRGVRPGSFLSAILSNDFMAAASRADSINQQALFDYIYFLYNYAPMQCHSSTSNFEYWCSVGGLEGLAAAEEKRQRENATVDASPASAPSAPRSARAAADLYGADEVAHWPKDGG